MLKDAIITPEMIEERMRSADPATQRLLTSPDLNSAMDKISKKYQLDFIEYDVIQLKQLVALTLLGLVPQNDLEKEIADFLTIDKETAKQVADEVATEILSGLKTKTDVTDAAPYVLHATEEIKQVAKPQNDYETPRSTFLRPTFKERAEGYEDRQAGSTAKIDIGEGEGYEPKKEIKSARTTPPKTKIVNYSALQTPEDPFKPKQTGPKTNVDPQNVIDLKDEK